MGGLSPIHWLIVIVVVAVLFGGRGKLSSIMGDAAKGIRAFKDGLKDEEHPQTSPPQTPPASIPSSPVAAAPAPPPPAPAPAPPYREDLPR